MTVLGILFLGTSVVVTSLPLPAEGQASALFRAAEESYGAGDTAGALKLFEASYRLTPAPMLWVDIAQCLKRLGRKIEAAEAYRRFLESRSGARHLRAEVFEALDEMERAAAAPIEPNESARQRSSALFQRGRARYEAGDFAGALDAFRTAAAEAPVPELWVNVAQCLRRLDRPEQAVLAYQAFLENGGGPREVRIEVWEALDETLSELDARMYRLADAAAQLERELATRELDPGTRTAARATVRDIRQTLVALDASLSRVFQSTTMRR